MENKKQDLMDESTVITRDIVQRIGEVLALIVIRYASSHGNHNLYWLYNGLLRDMSRRPDSENHYSEGYDIASTAICFLCDHIGKKLGDPVVNKYGKTITIKRACFRHVDRYLGKQYTNHYDRTVCLDDKLPAEPIIPFDTTEDDASAVDALIEKMHLKPKELDTLNAYMAGMKFMEITRFMNVNHTTIWRRMQNMKKKYLLAKGVV